MEEILKEAREAAMKAWNENEENWFCGFSWVTIRPARGPFVSYLKKMNIGQTGTYGGREISSYEVVPGSGFSQSMSRKYASCNAFANVLRSYGIKASASERPD